MEVIKVLYLFQLQQIRFAFLADGKREAEKIFRSTLKTEEKKEDNYLCLLAQSGH